VVQDVNVAASVADLTARLTPDHDRASLEIIDTFCRDLLGNKQPEAVLKLHSLEFRILMGSQRYEQQRRRQELTLLALRSSLRSRLKDDAGALELAQAGLNICPRCQTAIMSAAMALARAGRYDDAFAVLQQSREFLSEEATRTLWSMIARSGAEMQHAETATGPEQLRARAAALGTLELWGRAYDVLAPYKDEIKQAPKFSDGFAELAFRAGEPEVAREVLAVSKQPADIDRILAEWTDAMGWMK
jgi:predicted Zn-dependent protease